MGRRFLALIVALVTLLLAASTSYAYQIHLSIKGAGTVDEDPSLTQANLLDPACNSPQATPTGTVGANCYPGTPTGDYGYGWTVRWKATPMQGWSFVRWESDGSGTTYRTCDGQSGLTYSGASCQFGTFDNYQMRAVFEDTTAPTVTITDGPAAGSTTGTSVAFVFGRTDENAAQPASFRCRLTGPSGVVENWTGCTSGTFGKGYSGLSDGVHTFDVEIRDPSGNATAASRSWAVDATKPDTAISVGPTANSTTSSNTAYFEFTRSADATKSFCQIDSGTVVDPCSSPYTTPSLGDGSHTFRVWSQDSHGNVEDSPATRTWIVDSGPPDTQIVSGPAEGSSTESTTASFGFNSSESGSFECSLNGDAFVSCNSPRTYNGLTPGQYTFSVRAKDAANNVDASPATRTWTVTSPSPTGSAPQQTVGQAISSTDDSQVGDKLGADLSAAAQSLAKQKMGKLAKKGKFSVAVHSLQGGQFTLSFKGAATKQKAAKTTVIAKGSKSVTGAGTSKVSLTLTKAGKKLLRSGKRVKGTLSGSFTKTGGGSVTRSKSLTLKRR
jgi:hypothetical protein